MLWTTVPCAPNYEASLDGRIRNKKRGKPVGQRLGGAGYLMVAVWEPSLKRQVNQYVHRMIACTFLTAPLPGEEIDHIDRDKTNNSVENLRWVTHKENSQNRDNQYYPRKADHAAHVA